ncbi:site-specific tyrosine recombinase XerD [Couchioplanes caeruleus]|uniref:Tyrosine recombinase XerD n=2 Tax=Couchioplanes caeruleus TaxID=56438 RepID=A0A1K0FJX4_9ACTN|nr:site-specific tyrosine recombinase XerD [Couchioplanes caeruleus]OJF13167.1 site-specific tyrosine recombinase XerD [Couchioplanes caeruleus subsp. caeruleus]ROP33393.1 integrase/recombinase XerD [Couchioplanes caeruleus]
MTALRQAVRTYLDHLTVERGLSRNTLASYRRDLDRYLESLTAAGITELAAVTPADLTRHLLVLREGTPEHPPLSAASAARAVSAVRGLHRFAAREGLAAHDVSRDVKPPAPPRRLPKALDVDQVTRLLEAVTGDEPLALRDRALLEFLYGTGARISETVGLAVDDVDDAVVTLHGKGGRTRLVPLGSYARAALDAYLVRGRPSLAAAGRGTPAVFLNARGGALSRQSAWTILHRAAAAAGLPVEGAHAVSPHTLRHSYATHLLDGGADVRVVQELLGHASVTTTQVYTLVTVDRLREVYATAHPRAR